MILSPLAMVAFDSDTRRSLGGLQFRSSSHSFIRSSDR